MKGQELDDWLSRFTNEHPNNPIVHGQKALLLFGPSESDLSVKGDFNSWGRYQATEDSKNQSHIHAQSLGETGWRYLIAEAQAGARLQYALSDEEGRISRDPRNPSEA